MNFIFDFLFLLSFINYWFNYLFPLIFRRTWFIFTFVFYAFTTLSRFHHEIDILLNIVIYWSLFFFSEFRYWSRRWNFMIFFLFIYFVYFWFYSSHFIIYSFTYIYFIFCLLLFLFSYFGFRPKVSSKKIYYL